MAKTMAQLNEALDSVRTAIRAAETAQTYQTALGQSRTMASLQVLYERERALEAELAALSGGGTIGAMVRTVGRIVR